MSSAISASNKTAVLKPAEAAGGPVPKPEAGSAKNGPETAKVDAGANGKINGADLEKAKLGTEKMGAGKGTAGTENSKLIAVGEPKKDFYGTTIDKSKKQHHITFRDVVSGQQIADVKEVESYKEFNVLSDAVNAQCTCSLL